MTSSMTELTKRHVQLIDDNNDLRTQVQNMRESQRSAQEQVGESGVLRGISPKKLPNHPMLGNWHFLKLGLGSICIAQVVAYDHI